MQLRRVFFIAIFFISSFAWAQTDDFDLIEAEIKKSKPAAKTTNSSPAASENVETLSDLGRLAPFSEVSVLQRRYMPKSQRFQFYGGLSTAVNDPWFWGLGINARIAYGLTEKWGIEGVAAFLSSSQKEPTKDLFAQHGVGAESLVTSKGYYGANIMWTPIYGKLSLLNQKIVHFDMYFSMGGGSVSLENARTSSSNAIQVGTGQIFSLSKSLGLRWDLSILSYSANSFTGSSGSFNNVFLTVGASYYIPEVKYR